MQSRMEEKKKQLDLVSHQEVYPLWNSQFLVLTQVRVQYVFELIIMCKVDWIGSQKLTCN